MTLPIASNSPPRRSRRCLSGSCVVDGEAIVCDDNGLAVFDLIRGHGTNKSAILCVFDLLEINGQDIRREPIEDRKRRLAGLLRLPQDGIAINVHFDGDGAVIFKHACALGCEGFRINPNYSLEHRRKVLPYKNSADFELVVQGLRKAGIEP
jgi:ATP-dependent DNA ligase